MIYQSIAHSTEHRTHGGTHSQSPNLQSPPEMQDTCRIYAGPGHSPIIRVELHVADGYVLEQCGAAGPPRPVEGEVGRVVMLGEAALEHQIDALTRVQRVVAGDGDGDGGQHGDQHRDQANRRPKVTCNQRERQLNTQWKI